MIKVDKEKGNDNDRNSGPGVQARDDQLAVLQLVYHPKKSELLSGI